jgi:hypothetical protein
VNETAEDDAIRLPATPIQPIASAGVARVVADVSAGPALRGTRNIAGPEVFALDELGKITLAARGDHRIHHEYERVVVSDEGAAAREIRIYGSGGRLIMEGWQVADDGGQTAWISAADPSRHAAIDGTGRVRDSLDGQRLTGSGQSFRVDMYRRHCRTQVVAR